MISFQSQKNISQDKQNSTVLSTAVGGGAGYAVIYGIKKSKVGKIYSKLFMDNQKAAIVDNEEYFHKLVICAQDLHQKYPNINLGINIDDLKSAKSDDYQKKALKICSASIMDYVEGFSNEFILISKDVNAGSQDKHLVATAQMLIERNMLKENEVGILEAFIKNPADKSMFLSLEKIDLLKAYKELNSAARKVLVSPKLSQLANQMMDLHRLKDRGVNYFFLTPDQVEKHRQMMLDHNFKVFQQKMERYANKQGDNPVSKLAKSCSRVFVNINFKSRQKLLNQVYEQVKEGKNAFYLHGQKAAILPIHSNLREAVFHELGHATFLCNNGWLANKIGILKHKGTKYALPLIFFSSVFLKHRDDSNQAHGSKGVITKTREFVRNHIASISFAAFLPTLFDEAIASSYAINFLKNNVSQSQKSLMRGNLIKAWGSYFTGAALLAGTFKLAIMASEKTQDYLLNRKDKKQQGAINLNAKN